jgi:hypothetical protein
VRKRISQAEQERRYQEAMRREASLPPAPIDPPGRRLHAVPNPAEMNAVGSPTGRVARDAPETSVDAARAVGAKGQRATVLRALRAAGADGLTSIEAAAIMPPTRQGGPQVSNRAVSRLGELWEAGEAYVARERGRCVLGKCRPHRKLERDPHKPTAPCEMHGKPLTRDGASIWRAT